MSTRACYTFRDKDGTEVHVYKHSDGYPEGGLSWIVNALDRAWTLPRFEADEFAAAFVAANKDGEGNVRLIGPKYQHPWEFSGDSEYWYIVSFDKTLNVEIYDVNWWDDEPVNELQYRGPLVGAIRKLGAAYADHACLEAIGVTADEADVRREKAG